MDTIFCQTLQGSKYKPNEAETQLQKFKEYFLWFWGITLLLYIVLLLKHLDLGVGLDTDPGNTSLTAAEEIKLLVYPVLTYLLANVNLLFIFWCFVVLQSPAYDFRSRARQKLMVNYSTFVITLLIAVFVLLLCLVTRGSPTKTALLSYVTVFEGITGTLSGVALALLVARLDSKFIGLSWSLICILFTYAAIQPLFVVFELEANVFKTIESFVLIAALGLKVCFFLTIVHTLQSGKMLNYLVCFRILRDRVDSIFENQFEIKTSAVNDHQFTFSIWRKNSLVYSTAAHFADREQCDTAVEELHTLMEDFAQQAQPKPVAGTYWVEIHHAGGGLFCESIPLRSETERDDLIEESKENIPYCKYNRA